MLRYQIKPYRIDELTDSVIVYAALSNNKKFNDAKNTAKFCVEMQTLGDDCEFSFILTIYAGYNYELECGYAKYYIAGHLYNNNTWYYKQIKCIENCMTSSVPFGFTITEDNKYLICTYIGEKYKKNGQYFTFRFSRSLNLLDKISDIKLNSVYRIELEHKNFMFLPQVGDSYFYHKQSGLYDYWRILNDSNNISRSNVLASGLAITFKEPCSIRIPKRYTLWYAIASINMSRISKVNESSAVSYNKDITDIVNTKNGIPDRVSMYTTNINLIKNYSNYTAGEQILTSDEMFLKYDTQDDFNWYYHVEFPGGATTDAAGDNWIEVHGSNNHLEPTIRPNVAKSVDLTEKKLRYNLHNINNYFTSYFI